MIEACKQIVPPLVEVKPAHFAACIRISPEQPDIDRVTPGDAPDSPPLNKPPNKRCQSSSRARNPRAPAKNALSCPFAGEKRLTLVVYQ